MGTGCGPNTVVTCRLTIGRYLLKAHFALSPVVYTIYIFFAFEYEILCEFSIKLINVYISRKGPTTCNAGDPDSYGSASFWEVGSGSASEGKAGSGCGSASKSDPDRSASKSKFYGYGGLKQGHGGSWTPAKKA